MAVKEEYRANLLQKSIALASALLSGKCVSQECMVKRIQICADCDYVQIQGNRETGLFRCGICQCKLRSDRTLINLARYQETTRYGCHFPAGSKWKAAGV